MHDIPTTRVSIGLPVFNGENYLEACLEAHLGQTFEDFEIVISDNASTDNTADICNEFVKRDSRIRYLRQKENLGAASNYNIVFSSARGEFFRWSAHDDLILPDFLQQCVDVFEQDINKELAVVYTRTYHFDERTGAGACYDVKLPWGGKSAAERLSHCLIDARETIIVKCYPVFGLMRRSILEKTRLIQPFSSSDKVLLIELALRGDFHEVPEYLFHRRLHERTSLNANSSEEEVAAWFDPKKGGRFPMPRSRLMLGYLQAIREAPMSTRERLKCYGILIQWCKRNANWRSMLGECRIRLQQDLRMRSRKPTPIVKETIKL